ncbi:MAG TPA: potassium transporter TrkA [Acidimicrobiia bacterium]|nr:potassium transporter TrkA [Acidimicrobiia bacterium]
MRKFRVRRRPLPGIGQLFELDTSSGLTLSVVSHRSGRRDLVVAERGAEKPIVTAPLSRGEASAVAALLTGVHIELTVTST